MAALASLSIALSDPAKRAHRFGRIPNALPERERAKFMASRTGHERYMRRRIDALFLDIFTAGA